ncbi:conserved hypothetical protein [Candidatus Terasakiella magnetica]|uniref:Uncharacterized protein n=1 Tax=Candidatus Terasakiella magnetica TaxID=1867952 RepID=A0A1C3RI57_9PROT|nr:hypothetical protein [Candidatus Terasakiella magnetica]SCA56884.1 conserved hypothetical protein [Candidatus Terasakiella magnetica]
MFGFSPNKLLFTVIIIAAVWYAFKWLGRMQERQDKTPKNVSRDQGESQAPQASPKDAEYEELVACSKCGDYVIADKRSGCGKDGCPFDK